MSTETLHALYRAAIAADNDFQAELVRAYGASNAGQARYRYTHADARVTEAAYAARVAGDAWLHAYRAARAESA
jgi:hypothetical protein